MRVAIDVTPLLGAPTGVAQSLRGLLGGLADAQPDVEVVPFVLSGRAAGRGPVVVDGRAATGLPLPAGLAIRAWGRLDRPSADRWLGSSAVVHGSNFVVPPMRRRPTTATIHDCWCARHPERCSADVAAMTAAVRRAVARGAWLHVTTEHGAREVAEVYGATERVAVVPFAVPTVGVPGVPDGEGGAGPAGIVGRPSILALGALDPRKGLAGLVRAFGELAAVEPDVVLVLAGPDGPARPDLDVAISRLPSDVARRVHLLGVVDDRTRNSLLAGATVLAYPSLDEGFGFPVLEAMAAGVPVGDDDALCAALTALLGDDHRRDEHVTAGLARAATFTWARTASGMADLWRRAVDAGR